MAAAFSLIHETAGDKSYFFVFIVNMCHIFIYINTYTQCYLYSMKYSISLGFYWIINGIKRYINGLIILFYCNLMTLLFYKAYNIECRINICLFRLSDVFCLLLQIIKKWIIFKEIIIIKNVFECFKNSFLLFVFFCNYSIFYALFKCPGALFSFDKKMSVSRVSNLSV